MYQEVAEKGVLDLIKFFLLVSVILIAGGRFLISHIASTIVITTLLVALIWILWFGLVVVGFWSMSGGAGDITPVAIILSLVVIASGGVIEFAFRALSRVKIQTGANKA